MIDIEDFKEEVFKEYMKWVSEVSDDLEDKSSFAADEVVYKIVDIILEKLEDCK